ncbi:BRCA1 carboxy-terminus (BRCT) domain protein (macronuclear) [Tetrahymena thermophila SB210]|uniref:BRCA1 carboxy-terminus (BRCT) domain protein n=1 Tax=Tetrahymena thermophila (strain SB210) TaxID=312017 RepID=Q23CS2_TETTS|nr:BRCA1 carboxy-terminus (BRCT) domain protein [Tetrahymena thermophila SB210]EAR94696.2 BRCA1 carboxy-terminus (BRCT) domain protein [Tetrahymena thermophila SB210]|eukprot:XP_001014964.2 BRCA1 carboxy-terminus (BRCT) domain protein [Tetrahymena thermophila SB210]
MFRKQKDSVKVADLIIFCNEKDSQQYLVFDLKYGDNIIGKNSSLCSIVLRFTDEIDDVHTKISIEDDDYTIEDLGSQKGTFKIKSDNSLIRLKPNKSYDLSNNHIFYIGKYKCKFQIVKPGRAMAFSLSPTDILNSQKNNSNTSAPQNAITNSKRGSKKIQSYEDDIEDYTDLPSKQQHKKNQISSKIIQNRLEAENIDEEEDEKHFQKINNSKTALASSTAQSKKAQNTQKNFVKSKGQLAKGIKGAFKNDQKDEDSNLKKEDIYDITDTQLYKVSDEEEEDCDFQFSFPKSFKKSNNHEEEQATRKRAASNKKNNGIQTQQEQHDEDSMKLDSQFLKRIQDKLKNSEINEQRKVINDLAQKYSSQKNTQKQSQDIPFEDKKEKSNSLEKKESEDYWSPSTLKRKNTTKPQATTDKTKSKTLNKIDKNENEPIKVESSKKASKQKEQTINQEPTNKKNSKKQVEDQEIQEEPKKKEVASKSKKDLKLQQKKDDKMEKLKQQAENVLNTIKNSNQSKKQDDEQADKSKIKQKDQSAKNKTKSKTVDDSTSISDQNQEDEEYSMEEEDFQSQSQKIAKSISTRKRKYDDLMTQPTKQEPIKNSKSKEQKTKQTVNDKEKTKAAVTAIKEETPQKGKNSDAKKKQSKETPKAANSKETKITEEQKKSKSQNNKQQKKESHDKQVEKIEEEQPASLRRSTRKAQVEDEEKQEKTTKKSVSKIVQKTSAKKSTSKKQTKKESSDEGEQEEESQMEIEETKPTRKSARKSILKESYSDNKQQNEDQKSKDQAKKSKQTEKATAKSKKDTQKPKSLIRRTLGSKKEALLLQQSAGIIMDIPRRNKFRIIFSNSSITDEEKKEMSTYGVKILNDFHSANDFNILVTDEFKRRLKTLVALNKGYPIISQNWIKECIKEDKIVPYEPFIITKVDKALAKQHNFELKKSINNQKDHPEGILHGLTFVCQNSFDNLNKEEVRKLVESAGGSFLYEKPKHTSAYFLSDPSKTEYNKQQNESNEIVLDIEGLLQTCLLQYNVLDNYIITTPAKEKKSTKKK